MQVSDNFGPIYQSVALDASGNGAVSFQATGSNIRLSNVFFRVETANRQAVCTIYKGQIAPGNIVLNSNSGSTGSNAQGNVDLFDGETCYVVWTGGDAGSTATATFSGGKIPFGEVKPSQLEAQDPIAAGDGSLVYPALKSPNYQTGVQGWTLDRNGNAELNDVVVRGELLVTDPDGSYVKIYDQDPGDGALIELGLPSGLGVTQEPGSIITTAATFGQPGMVITPPTVNGSPKPVLSLTSDPVSDVSRIRQGATDLVFFAENQIDVFAGGSVVFGFQPGGGDFLVSGSNTLSDFEGDVIVQGTLTGGTPYCRIAKNASQTLPNNTVTDIAFQSVIEDDRGWYNPSQPTRITPDLPGRYLVIGNLTFMGNSTGDRRGYIRKNGTNSGRWSRDYPSGNVQVQTTVTAIVTVNGTTDYITIGGLQSSGGNLDMSFGAGDGDSTFSCTFEVIYQGSVP